MDKKMVRLFLVTCLCLTFLSACGKKVVKKPNIDPSPIDKPMIETTIDPAQLIKPTPVTGDLASKDPASLVIIDYFYSIQTEQYEKAYALITGEFKKKKGTFTEFLSPLAQAAANGRKYDKVTILAVNTSQSGMEKVVTCTLTIYENQNPMTLTGAYVVVQKKDLTWVITDTITMD